jgi:hypothetical protein
LCFWRVLNAVSLYAPKRS